MEAMKKYHGWIYIEKSAGYKDHYSAQWKDKHGNTCHKPFGYGCAAEAVDHFETTLGLGPVQLQETPVGLRVFTAEKKEKEG